MKTLLTLLGCLSVAGITFISSCSKPHNLPYYKQWNTTRYGNTTYLPPGGAICITEALETSFRVNCQQPMSRVELLATNTTTQAVDTILAVDFSGTTYADTLVYQLKTTGHYLITLSATAANFKRNLARFEVTCVEEGKITVTEPAYQATIPYNSQLQGFTINGIVEHVSSANQVHLSINGPNGTLPIYQSANLSGSGPTRSFQFHVPSLPAGDYVLIVYGTQACQIGRNTPVTISN